MAQDDGEDDQADNEDCAIPVPEAAGDDGAPHAEGTHARGDDDDGADEDGVEAGLDAQGLRQQWQELQQACRRMEGDPAMPPSIVAEARKLRDDAEQRWRAAKAPHPLSKRMRWAEADLRAAEQKEEARRAELEQHLEAAARRTRELEERIKVDVERTARKRAALQELLAEGAPGHVPAADRIPAARAATAVTGISTNIAPQLAAAIERLGSPMESDTAEHIRQDLQVVAVSISNLEEVLRGTMAPTVPIASTPRQQQQRASHFHIGSDGGGGGDSTGAEDDDARGGKRRALSAGGGATTVARWTKSAVGDAWTKRSTSASAKEEALRILGAHGGGAGSAAAGGRGDGSDAASISTQPAGAAETNDLAEAERRARQAAQHQFQESQQRQHQRADAKALQQDELDRQQRRQRQEEELLAHQQAAQRAAEERAAEETRQREELLARMSPQELARAAELHAQQMAIGAQAFGTQAASEMAGLVHQQHAHSVARTSAACGMQADADQLIAMSPEELARWDREQQATAGEVPW